MTDHQRKQWFGVALFLLGIATAGFGPYHLSSVAASDGNDTPTPIPQMFSIAGKVVNASGGEVPEEMPVTLQAYSGMETILEQVVELSDGGSYRFSDIPLDEDWVYLVGGEYKKVSFYSDLLYGDVRYSGREVDLPLTIYESSTDPSALHAERGQVFVSFPDDQTIRVTQSFMISNLSNRVIIPRGENMPLLEFLLPDGAENLTFEHGSLGERFVLTENGFGDRSKVGPGTAGHQVMYSYTMPYDGGCSLTLTMPMDVRSFLVGLPTNGVRLNSLHLKDIGERYLEGMNMRLYTGNELRGGTRLQLRFAGEPHLGQGEENPIGMTVVGVGTFMLALIIVVAWMSQHQPHPAAAEAQMDKSSLAEDVLNSAGHTVTMLLESIASLDDLYRTGKLSENVYSSLRAELKRRLRDAREKENGKNGD